MEDFKNNNFVENSTINIRQEIEKYLIHWKWFVIGTSIAFVCAFLSLRYSTLKYSATASIMIKDNNKSGISAQLATFEDL